MNPKARSSSGTQDLYPGVKLSSWAALTITCFSSLSLRQAEPPTISLLHLCFNSNLHTKSSLTFFILLSRTRFITVLRFLFSPFWSRLCTQNFSLLLFANFSALCPSTCHLILNPPTALPSFLFFPWLVPFVLQLNCSAGGEMFSEVKTSRLSTLIDLLVGSEQTKCAVDLH